MSKADLSKPIVVLHRVQLGENIGMSARAMGNCGLENLRLSSPRQGWDRDKARAAAAGAAQVVDGLEVYASLPSALADCSVVLATSARRRNVSLRVIDSEMAAQEIHTASGRVALLFGAESTGLDNDSISLADAVIEIPLNPDCTSLNLSQAVLLVAYAWWRRLGQCCVERKKKTHVSATRRETAYLLARLEGLLASKEFFTDENLRPVLWRNVRAMIHRSGFSTQEVQTWHGIFSALLRR